MSDKQQDGLGWAAQAGLADAENYRSVLRPSESSAPDNNQGFMGDMVDATQHGMGQAAAGLAEAGHQLTGFESLRDASIGASEWAGSQIDQMSAAGRESFQKEIFTEDGSGDLSFGDGASDINTWLLQLGSLAGQMVPQVAMGGGVGALGAKVASRVVTTSAARTALAQGASKEAAKRIGIDTAARVMSAGGNAKAGIAGQALSDLGISTGMASVSAREEFTQHLTIDELNESEAYQEEFWTNAQDMYGVLDPAALSPEQTNRLHALSRERMGDAAAEAVARDPSLLVTNLAMGAVGGKYIDDLLRGAGTGSRLTNAGKQALAQGGTEAVQGGMEQYAVNTAVADQGIDRDPMEGVKAAAANEAVLGGTLGGVAGAISKGEAREAQSFDSSEYIKEQVQADQPEKQDASPDSGPAEKRRGQYRGIDDDIHIADKQGFYEDAVRLRSVKQMFERAQAMADRGMTDAAARMQRKAQERYDSVFAESKAGESLSGGLPSIYTSDGELVGGELIPASPRKSGETIDGQVRREPGQVSGGTPGLIGQQSGTRLESGNPDTPWVMEHDKTAANAAKAQTEQAFTEQQGEQPKTSKVFATAKEDGAPSNERISALIEQRPDFDQHPDAVPYAAESAGGQQNAPEQQDGGIPYERVDIPTPEQPALQIMDDAGIDYRPEFQDRTSELAGRVTDRIRDHKLPENFKDPRLLRDDYRGQLKGMAEQLVFNGGSMGAVTTEGNRAPSENPPWYVGLDDEYKRAGTNGFKRAVTKALAGEKLLAPERRAIEGMFEVLKEERRQEVGFAKQQRSERNKFRQVIRGELNPVEAGFVEVNPESAASLVQNRKPVTRVIDEITDESFVVDGIDDYGRETAQTIQDALEAGVPEEVVTQVAQAKGGDVLALNLILDQLTEEASRGKEITPASVEGIAASGTVEEEPAWTQESAGEPVLSSYDQSDLDQLNEREGREGREGRESAGEQSVEPESPGSFVLAGSDLPADQAEARGQTSLLDSPPDPVQQRTESTQETPADAGVSRSEAPNISSEDSANSSEDSANSSVDSEGRPPIRNRRGNPFKTRGAAKALLRKNPGYEVAEVKGGFELQWKGDSAVASSTPISDAITAGVPPEKISTAISSSKGSLVDLNANMEKEVEAAAQEAATSPENTTPEPTQAQIEAGNYKKGHTKIQGLDVTIENPRGSNRSGTDPDGHEWSVEMKHHYGYIKKTTGADGEHIDVFVGKEPESQKVFVIDQVNADGTFDEHKVMLGFRNRAQAVHGYKSNYEKGWKVGPVTTMTTDQFKDWLAGPDTDKPVDSKLRAETKPVPGVSVSENTVFTEDAAAKARELLRKKLGQHSSGIDPEIMQAGITLAGYHIEKGARTFAAYAKAMTADLGDVVKPYLKSWYMGVKYDPRAANFDGMDDAATVDSASIDKILSEKEASNEHNQRSSTNLERDSKQSNSGDGVGQESVQDGHDGDGRTGGSGVSPAQQGGRDDSGERVSGRQTPAAGAQGNIFIPAESSRVEASAAGSELNSGSGDSGVPGQALEPATAEATNKAATSRPGLEEKRKLQQAADSVPVQVKDRDNIAKTLPFLLEGQQDDVLFAEERFSKPDGYGVLFTNGTGTGKTATGLGAVKRFARQGKTNTVILVPTDKIASDWVSFGRNLGLNITQLSGVTDAGSGIVVTTYANFGQNNAVVHRNWDLVVGDESHYFMQSKDGNVTLPLKKLRAITKHPNGYYPRFESLYRKELDEQKSIEKSIKSNKALMHLDDTRDAMRGELDDELKKLSLRQTKLDDFLKDKREQVRKDIEDSQGAARTRTLFLSATPFAYEKTIDYAEGYLFSYPEDGKIGNSNQSGFAKFMVEHFGYRIRYHKLTEPEADVDRGIMQRQFNTWLKQQGVLSGRMLDVTHDYDRKFVLTESAIGTEIDRAMQWIGERSSNDNENSYGYRDLAAIVRKRFDHLTRRYLLEAIKAKESIPIIKKHIELGRKVVVFHDFKRGGGFNPFRFEKAAGDSAFTEEGAAYNAAVDAFNDEFQSVIESPIWLAGSPINELTKAFPDALLFNGDVPKKQRRENAAKFNDDDAGYNLIIGQSDAMKEGVSLHDTTGKSQRVLINLGLPTKPTTAIQQEGRIFRVGQASNAMFRYLNTGTNWERWAFASTIAQRSSTAENLAIGEQARSLMDAFIDGFEDSDTYPPGHDGEGTGGKEKDKQANAALTEWDRAMTMYYGQLKRNSKTKSLEGIDYFPTPEPLGLKMVEWADIRSGDKAMEPSAGHGAIARWLPDNANRIVVEPESELASRLKMVTGDSRLVTGTFENLDVGGNKVDAVVMNPPFGRGGSTAIKHLEKAAKHLNDGGRIVALIPTGSAADKKFDSWFYGQDSKGKPVAPDLYLRASIKLPSVTFERAGTKVAARIVVIDKQTDKDAASGIQQLDRNYSSADTVKEFFNRIEHSELPGRPEAKPKAKPTTLPKENGESSNAVFKLAETRHAKKGIDLYVASLKEKLDYDEYKALEKIAKQHNGYYSKFSKNGAIPGFQFETADDRQAFLDAAKGDGEVLASLADRIREAAKLKQQTKPPTEAALLHKGQVEKWIRDADKLVADNVTVVPRFDDLPLSIRTRYKLSDAGDLEGIFDQGTGKAYVIADRIPDASSALKTATHEVVGHKGVIAFLKEREAKGGRDFFGVLDDIYKSVGRRPIDRMVGRYGFDYSVDGDRRNAVLEYIAHLSETGKKPSLVQRAVGALKAVIRRLVPSVPWSETDVLVLIQKGRGVLKQRGDADSGLAKGDAAPLARLSDSLQNDDSLTEQQKDALSKIGPKSVKETAVERIAEALNRWRLKLRQGVVDRFAALMEMDKQLLDGGITTEENITRSSWVRARMSNAASGAVTALMNTGRIYLDAREGVIDVRENSKGLVFALSKLGSAAEVEKFFGWIAGNRADKLREEGRENLFDDTDIDALKSLNRGTLPDGRNRDVVYQEVFAEFQQYRDDVLAIADKAGLLRKGMEETEAMIAIAREAKIGKAIINRIQSAQRKFKRSEDADEQEIAAEAEGAAIAELSELLAQNIDDFESKLDHLMTDQKELWMNEFYVPFYRVLEEQDQAQGPRVVSGLSRQEAYKKLKGGTQNVNDLLQNTIMNFHHLVDASMKNLAAQQAIDNAEALGIAGQTSEAARDKKASTFVLREGRQVWYNIDDPFVYQALTSLNHTGMNGTAMKVMRGFKRMFTNFTTSTPQFIIANAIRDSLSAIATTDLKANPVGNMASGIKAFGVLDRHGYQRARLMASGGAFSFGHAYGEDAESIRISIDGELRRAKIIRDAKGVSGLLKSGWDRWQDVSNSAENANRMAAFKQAEEAGKGKLYAAFQARDLMDFSGMGAWPLIRFFIDTVPFLNARIQGLDKLYRAGVKPTSKVVWNMLGRGEATGDEKQAAARFMSVVGALSVASIALYLHNKDDEEFQKAPDWMKDTYWWVRIGGKLFLIPKPFEVGAIATLVERLVQQMVDDKATGELFAERLGFMLTNTFSFSPIPQIAQPALDVYANRDSFTGRDIESMGMERLSPSNRTRSDTSYPAKWTGVATEAVFGADSKWALSPVQIDYLIGGYFGQIGTWVAGLADVGVRAISGEERPASHWYEWQPMRRFYRDLNAPNPGKYQTLFYEALRESARLQADIRQYKEYGELAKAAETTKDNKELLRLRKRLNRAQRQLSKINAQIRQVERGQLSAEEKRRRIDLLKLRKQQIIERIQPVLEGM